MGMAMMLRVVDLLFGWSLSWSWRPEENADGDGVIDDCVGYDGGKCGVDQSMVS